jgi:sterol desaturase/sphingolipid hydroxylase (fatty acid hydroxylase superfamily)
MNFIELLIPVFISLIIFELIINATKKAQYYSLPDTISDMSLGIISRLTDIFVLMIMYQVYFYLQNHFSLQTILKINLFHFNFLPVSNFPILLWTVFSWSFLFLSLDFLFYWNHRFSHEINLLWASHVAHHSSEEYNLTVALRQSFLRNTIALCFYIVFSFLSVPWEAMLLTDALNRLYQFWVHTRFIKKLPNLFEFLFVTPAHHRVHHARNPEYLDKNYAGVFIFWDRIFGTFKEETIEPIYGIVKPLQSFNPMRANLHVFRDIFKILRSKINLNLKIKAFTARPNFVSSLNQNLPKHFHENSIPPKGKYQKLSPMQSMLVTIIFLTLIGLSLSLIKLSSRLSIPLIATFYFSLLGGYGLVGNYLDRKTKFGH